MLSPSRKLILLPQDRKIMQCLGWSESEYRYFCKQASTYSQIRPGDPTAFIFITPAIGKFVLNLAIGAAFTAASALFTRSGPRQRNPAQIVSRQEGGQDITRRSTAISNAGFGAVQSVAQLGSTIPVIYAHRENIDGVAYGGIRVGCELLWSQITSNRGSLLFRGVFMVGEGDPVYMEIDPKQIAFGGNLVNSYALTSKAGRLSIYYRQNGGRIRSTDLIQGRSAATDPGNAERFGGPDVYSVYSIRQGRYVEAFSGASKPSNQTVFGLYSPIGNAMSYRINPTVRAQSQMNLKPSGTSGNVIVECFPDLAVVNERSRNGDTFNSYAAVLELEGDSSGDRKRIEPGQSFKYTIQARTDAAFTYNASGGFGVPDAQLDCRDIGSSIASRSSSYDQALQEGELYLAGSALCICDYRTPRQYASQANGGNSSIVADMTVIEGGYLEARDLTEGPETAKPIILGTSHPHLFRIAIASFVTERACEQIDITIRSAVGITVNGLMAFNNAKSESYADTQSCNWAIGQVFSSGAFVTSTQYRSGAIQSSEERYSGYRIGYRVAGTDDEYLYLEDILLARGLSGQAVYNSISLLFPSPGRWQGTLKPVSGWEIRKNPNNDVDRLWVLDPALDYRQINSAGLVLRFRGEPVTRSAETFSLRIGESDGSLGWPYAEDVEGRPNYIDAYGKLAELFLYDEISANLDSPEHEIVSIAQVIDNEKIPRYDNIAALGTSVLGGPSFPAVDEVSVYVKRGQGGFHDFPLVLLDMLTSDRYGVGSILSEKQIDKESFAAASEWTRSQRYFFDGIIDSKLNIISWAFEQGRYHLLDVIVQNGKFSLRPSVYFDRPEPVTALFTAGNILEGSFSLNYRSQEARQPRIVSVKWREERPSGDAGQSGLFPQIQEVLIREAGTPDNAPIETIDMSRFATSEKHAIDVGKFECRASRLVDFDVSLATAPTDSAVRLGACIRLGVETVSYETPKNGFVLGDGTVNSWPPLPDGRYSVLLWDGTQNEVQETFLTISGGRAPSAANSVFCVATQKQEAPTCKVSSVGFDSSGNLEITAEHFPCDDAGYSLIVDRWDDPTAWIIER